jgi:UDPglucose 6-dehydrogenase
VIVSVLGTGYLGATHAACLASLGHTVVGVDADPERVEALRAGRLPFHEPGLHDLLTEGLASGRLSFSDRVEDAAHAEAHFLCVGTPQREDDDTLDLAALDSVVAGLAPLLKGPALVVGKSTVPVGTAARVRDELRRLSPAGDAVGLAWNPEFLREGCAVEDSLRPSRLVLGVEREEDLLMLRELYADLLAAGTPLIRTDLPTAELAKVAANAMLATRISMVNLLAEICESAGADVEGLTEILGADARIGGGHLRPGLGYGGGCLPKDTRGLLARARELGLTGPLDLLAAVDSVNTWQRMRTVERVRELLGGRPGAVLAVLGGAFKAGSDDVRDSPALAVACALQEDGVPVRLYDPEAGVNVRRTCPGLEVADSVADAVADAGLVLVATEWPEFAALDPVELGARVAERRVLDARLVLDVDKWRAAGWDVHALGRASYADPTAAAAPAPVVPAPRTAGDPVGDPVGDTVATADRVGG